MSENGQHRKEAAAKETYLLGAFGGGAKESPSPFAWIAVIKTLSNVNKQPGSQIDITSNPWKKEKDK